MSVKENLKRNFIAGTTKRDYGRQADPSSSVVWDSEHPGSGFFDGQEFTDEPTDFPATKVRVLNRALPVGPWQVDEGSERDL
jgi:hypothetical protein